MKRLLALVLTMGIAFSLLAGCTQNANNGDENGGNTGNKEWKIGLIAAGTFGDNGLNDALKKAAETFTYDIPLPDGVDNLSGVTSVTLTILFDDIDSLTVDATQFGYENLTTERDVTVVTSTLSVTLRGTSTALARVNEENLRVVADLTNVSDADGVYAVPATVYVDGLDVGAVGSYQVTVRLSGGAENSTEHN